MNAAVYLWRRWQQIRGGFRPTSTTVVFQIDETVDAAAFTRAIRRELNRQLMGGTQSTPNALRVTDDDKRTFAAALRTSDAIAVAGPGNRRHQVGVSA